MSAAIREDAPYREFALRLKELRLNAGLTREELGKLVGIAGRSIINYENGERIPFGDVCAKLAQVFGITADELLGLDNTDLTTGPITIYQLRNLTGKKGAERLRRLYATMLEIADGDLPNDLLLEFCIEMSKASEIALQNLRNRKNKNNAEAEQTATSDAIGTATGDIAPRTSVNEQ